MKTERRPLVFLDRDDTIIRDTGYTSDPGQVELLPGAAEAIRTLRDDGYTVVVATNQSGIGRGLMTVQQYKRVDKEMHRQLAEQGARVDRVEYCPDPPGRYSPDRKPALGMFIRAAQRLNRSPYGAIFIGDRWRDVQPALELKGQGWLIGDRVRPAELPSCVRCTDSLLSAIRHLLRPAPGRTNRPLRMETRL